ncbi:serpin family protein [Oscillatoriales cyanobacterium LEGE 11467]|uniref:Serpin family protein n=1 Tax=Zarconia navalis LEGE 11467 TaxID=1828826 RepID=A0A928VZG9_9CYAN|nr:serpin family protein [Zarconia navalis]MBE9041687.1 serpin family protein [Zarconia navalis LEGE 11467]
MKFSLVGFFFVAFSAIASWVHLRPTFSQETAIEKPAEINQLVEGNSAFALDLYDRLRQEKANENLFFSPYSISTALAMTYGGARGETELEMARVLHFSLDRNSLHASFAQLIAAVETPPTPANHFRDRQDPFYQLSTANRLWGQQGESFEPQFLNLLEQYYDSGLETVDFIGDTVACRHQINAWVAQQTQDKIQDLIGKDILNEQTRFVLTNAIYFQGDWLVPFDPERTQNETFTTASGAEIEVPMMYQKDYFDYTQVEGWQVLELPYRGETLSMVVLLPDTTEDLETLEQRFTPERLQEWLSSVTSPVKFDELVQIQVWLPKFKVTSEFELNQILSMMGMPSAFGDRSDFSGINGQNDLFLTHVIHKAFVEVNETGTEAAAATAIGASRGSPPSIEFRANRPFVFLIRHRDSGTILFLGRVVNPLESSSEPIDTPAESLRERN